MAAQRSVPPTLPVGPAPVPWGPSAVPVSLLPVGRFVGFPVSGKAKRSCERTKMWSYEHEHGHKQQHEHKPTAQRSSPRKGPVVAKAKRLVVLVSGSGTNL